ncbi:hypothetical protein ACFQMA_22005 [Halosimplex aquaticum]|uniref:Tripartite tricarboxylate transporter TctB family protein n=1 Tax=Halosimplex aquaticum TaxID=3026162 RepID=A0ABD5Y580_9EURY|nr:hypothetical protein [Halosimplex aquaticum]
MSLESTRRPYSSADRSESDDAANLDDPDTGSVWWAELSLGAVCWLAAGAVALSQTSIGPFSSVSFVYGTIPTTLYLVAATALGLSFLRSGFRRAP